MLADTTKSKKTLHEESDSGSTSVIDSKSSGKSRNSTKSANSGSVPLTNKESIAMENEENTKEDKFLVPIGSKWSEVSEQLAKITSHAMANNKAEKNEVLQELLACAPVLREEDMDMFGVTPSTDTLSLVVCVHCSKAIKSSRFLSHTELCQSIKDLPAEDTNKRKVPETLSRPPKKPLHDLQAKPLAAIGSPDGAAPRSQKPSAQQVVKQQKVKTARPTLLRTADGRFAPMNKLKKQKGKFGRNRKPVEARTPEEASDEEESNAPRTPEYDRDDDATVPSSAPSDSPSSPSSTPPPSYYIPPPPPLPSTSRSLLIAAGHEGPAPLATRSFARQNKLRRIIVSLVPSVLIQQKQQLCTIYHEQPLTPRTSIPGSLIGNTTTNLYTTTTSSSLVNSYSSSSMNPPYLYSHPTKEEIKSELTSGNFQNRAASMSISNNINLNNMTSNSSNNINSNNNSSPISDKKKLLKKKPLENSSSPLVKKKRKSDDGENGVPSADIYQNPSQTPPLQTPLSPTLRNTPNLGPQTQNLGPQTQNLGPNQTNVQNPAGIPVKIYKNNSVNLQIGPNSGQEMSTNMFPLQSKSAQDSTNLYLANTQQTQQIQQQQQILQQQMQHNQQMLANSVAPSNVTTHPTNLSQSGNTVRKPAPVRTPHMQNTQTQQQQLQQLQQHAQQTQQTQAQTQAQAQAQPTQAQAQQPQTQTQQQQTQTQQKKTQPARRNKPSTQA